MDFNLRAKLEKIGNAYETLHIEENATQKQISKAHKKLARLLHPDKNREIDTRKFNFIQIFIPSRRLIHQNSAGI